MLSSSNFIFSQKKFPHNETLGSPHMNQLGFITSLDADYKPDTFTFTFVIPIERILKAKSRLFLRKKSPFFILLG